MNIQFPVFYIFRAGNRRGYLSQQKPTLSIESVKFNWVSQFKKGTHLWQAHCSAISTFLLCICLRYLG